MLDVRISLDGDERAPDVASLYRWLRTDLDDLHPGKISLRSEPPTVGLMGVMDFIHMLIENPEAIAALASSLARWCETLRRKPTLRLERDGQTYVIEDVSPEEIRRILGLGLGRENGDEGEG